MKKTMLAWLLISLIPAASACDLMGVKGEISEDGTSITTRNLIPLREQAKQYGGYAGAANYIEQNRLAILRDDKLSPDVKRQVNVDLLKNVEQLKCWTNACSKESANTECRF